MLEVKLLRNNIKKCQPKLIELSVNVKILQSLENVWLKMRNKLRAIDWLERLNSCQSMMVLCHKK